MKRHLLLIIAILSLAPVVFCKGIEPGCYHLKGKIDGKYAITMDLTISYWSNRGLLASGYYSYDVYMSPIKVDTWDRINSLNDTLILHTQTNEIFKAIFVKDSLYGIWQQMDEASQSTKKMFDFTLVLDTISCINLHQSSYADHVSVHTGNEYNKAFFAYSYLYPSGLIYVPLLNPLLSFYGGSSSMKGVLEKYMKGIALNFFHDFKVYVLSMYTPNGSAMHIGWDQDYHANVICNNRALLSVELTHSTYMGGSHGDYENTYVSISTQDNSILKLSDVVSYRDTNVLKKVWINYLRKAKWVGKETDDLTAMQISLPSKYYLTPKGMMLMFTTMAPGGGEFLAPIFVPFEELGQHLKEQPWMQL